MQSTRAADPVFESTLQCWPAACARTLSSFCLLYLLVTCCRLSDLEVKASAWSKSAGLAKSAVQQQELAAGLAQLSTAASRRDHERAQQVAGLASRVEALEQQTASRDQVVTQVSTSGDRLRCQAGRHRSVQPRGQFDWPVVPTLGKAASMCTEEPQH